MRSAPKSLSRWEIVGAWLHVWTPPRDADVPPVPRRKLALGAVALAGLVALTLALVVPPLQTGKRKGAEERAREEAVAVAREAARLRKDQAVHVRIVPAGADLVAALENAVNADAKARARAGKLDGPVLSTACDPATRYVIQFPASRVYKCFVKTTTGHAGVLPGDQFGTGYPFVATIYTRTRRIAWCKENPRPDEKTRGHKLADVKMSPVCAGKLSQVL
jgi:type II secretory pathway pseudopilin PulG